MKIQFKFDKPIQFKPLSKKKNDHVLDMIPHIAKEDMLTYVTKTGQRRVVILNHSRIFIYD